MADSSARAAARDSCRTRRLSVFGRVWRLSFWIRLVLSTSPSLTEKLRKRPNYADVEPCWMFFQAIRLWSFHSIGFRKSDASFKLVGLFASFLHKKAQKAVPGNAADFLAHCREALGELMGIQAFPRAVWSHSKFSYEAKCEPKVDGLENMQQVPSMRDYGSKTGQKHTGTKHIRTQFYSEVPSPRLTAFEETVHSTCSRNLGCNWWKLNFKKVGTNTFFLPWYFCICMAVLAMATQPASSWQFFFHLARLLAISL